MPKKSFWCFTIICIILSSKACTWPNIVELLQDLLITYAEDFEKESDRAFSFIRTISFFAQRGFLCTFTPLFIYLFFNNVQRLCICVHLREGLRIGKNWLRFHRNLIVLTLEPKMLILIEWNNSFSILTEIDNVTLNNKRLTLSSNEPSTFATFVQEKRSSVTAFSSAADGLIVFRIGRHEL